MFKNKYYPTFMYLSIIIVMLLIIFNFMDIIEKSNSKLTGHAISNESIINSQSFSLKKILDAKEHVPEYIYNFLVLMLVLLISGILMKFIDHIQLKEIK